MRLRLADLLDRTVMQNRPANLAHLQGFWKILCGKELSLSMLRILWRTYAFCLNGPTPVVGKKE